MEAEFYIEERLQNQIDWYNAKSSYNQKWYNRLKFYEIISAALIPFLTGLVGKWLDMLTLIAILGIFIAVCSAASSLFKFQENWIQYRCMAEYLMHEKFLFLTSSGQYQADNALQILVERVEGLIANQNTSWRQYVQEENS